MTRVLHAHRTTSGVTPRNPGRREGNRCQRAAHLDVAPGYDTAIQQAGKGSNGGSCASFGGTQTASERIDAVLEPPRHTAARRRRAVAIPAKRLHGGRPE